MPEIWLNYGAADVVLDVKAENLGATVGLEDGKGMDGGLADEKLSELVEPGGEPLELAVLHDTPAVRQVAERLFAMCERKSAPRPRVLADGAAARGGPAFPGGAAAGEIGGGEGGGALPEGRLVFLAEMEMDGLFGYETVASRLLRRFGGGEYMLAAYAKRAGNAPAPGAAVPSLDEAASFAGRFEVRCVEALGGPGGLAGLAVGHPSETASLRTEMEASAVRDAGRHRAVVISTGKEASSSTLSRALNSLWSCQGAVDASKGGGIAVLLAESGGGLGSAALRARAEGWEDGLGGLESPARYTDGMEDLLFLRDAAGRGFQIGLVSALPEFYAKGLGMVPLGGARRAMDHILRTMGQRQKVAVVADGARLLLR